MEFRIHFPIYVVQVMHIALTNGIILGSFKVKGFKICRIQQRSSNPYDLGVIANFFETLQPIRHTI
jgi:hypothetical protein